MTNQASYFSLHMRNDNSTIFTFSFRNFFFMIYYNNRLLTVKIFVKKKRDIKNEKSNGEF